jgi:osmotically-inducible protein OsmY
MEPQTERSDRYLVAHLQEALAADPRTEELGIEVTVAGSTVVLSGTVATAQRREAVAAVAREALREHEIRNEVTVAELTEPADTERLS